MGYFDNTNCREIDLNKCFNVYTIRAIDYSFTLLMFKAIHGFPPNYLLDLTDMNFDIHGHDAKEAGSMNVYRPTVHDEIYRFFSYFVKNIMDIETCKCKNKIFTKQ